MSMLGFNFAFGARDDGFANALTRASEGIKGVGSQVDSLGRRISSGNFFNALNTLQLDRIGDELSQLRGQGQQLETSLGANFRNMGAEIRPTLALMGLSGKEFAAASSQITSTAYRLNVGASDVASSFRAIQRAGRETQDVLGAMGIKMEQLTLISKATGLGAEDFTALVRGLTESYRFNTQEASAFLNGFTNLTQQLGIADISFGSLKETMSTLDGVLASNTQFMQMSRDEQVQYVQEQVMGIQRLTKAFMGLGHTPEAAQSAALEFFKSLSAERKTMDGMTIGLDDMGETFKKLAQEAGFQAVDGLFSDISSSPLEALQQIAAMQQRLVESAGGDITKVARFNRAIDEMAGGLSFMKDAGAGISARLAEVSAASEKTGKGLVAMAKSAHTANRSIDELLQMAEDRFEESLIKTTGNTRTQFVQQQTKMYDTVLKKARELSDDSTWGPLTKQFIAARKIGAAAFFLPMQRDAKQTESAIKGVDTAVGKGGLLGRLEAVKTLGLAGFFLDLNGSFKTQADRIKDAESAAMSYYARIEALGLSVDTLKPALLALGTAFASLMVISKVVSMMGPLVSVGGAVISMFGALAGVIGSGVAVLAASPIVIGAAIAASIYAVGKLFDYLAEAPQALFDSIADSIKSFGSYIDKAFDFLMSIDTGALTESALNALGGWFMDTVSGLVKFIKTPSKYMPIVYAIGSVFASIGKLALGAAISIGEVFLMIGKKLVEMLLKGLGVVGEGLYSLLVEPVLTIVNDIKGPMMQLGDYLISPFKSFYDWIMDNSIGKFLKQYFIAPLFALLSGIGNLFVDFINFMILDPLSFLLNKVVDLVRYLAEKLPDVIKTRLGKYGLDKLLEGGEVFDLAIKRDTPDDPFTKYMDAEVKPVVKVDVSQDANLREQQRTNALLSELTDTVKGQRQTQPPGAVTRGVTATRIALK